MFIQPDHQTVRLATTRKRHRPSPSAPSSRSHRFSRWGLGSLALLLVSCQPSPPAPTPSSSETPIATNTSPAANSSAPATSPSGNANPGAANSSAPERSTSTTTPAAGSPSASKQYENQAAGFRFTYPADFVIADVIANAANEPARLELWQQDIHAAIVAGKYEGGTEYPPNVEVMIGRNPDRLFLKDWVERQPDRFSLPKDFEEHSVAGQNGLSFRSTGLYEHENVVVASPDMKTIMVISLATIGVPRMDDPNRRAFTQILDSFQLASSTQP